MTRLLLVAIAALALALLLRRRDERIPARWAEPGDGVQPWDPYALEARLWQR